MNQEQPEVPEDQKIIVCYFCGKLYNHKYDECICGCSASPITTVNLSQENLKHKSEIKAFQEQILSLKEEIAEYRKALETLEQSSYPYVIRIAREALAKYPSISPSKL